MLRYNSSRRTARRVTTRAQHVREAHRHTDGVGVTPSLGAARLKRRDHVAEPLAALAIVALALLAIAGSARDRREQVEVACHGEIEVRDLFGVLCPHPAAHVRCSSGMKIAALSPLVSFLLGGCGRIDFDPLSTSGDGDASTVDASPRSVVQSGAGGLGTCVLLGSGAVWCWGVAENKGNGDTTTHTGVPGRVATSLRIAALETADGGSCGMLEDHRAICWGSNSLGQLGVGSVGVVSTPQPMIGENNIAEISLGYFASCLLRRDHTVACAGKANLLGRGVTTNASTFATVSSLGPAIDVAAGDDHMCVLLTTGAVTCWGANSNFQLGDGTMTASSTPIAGPLGPYTQIAAGDNHTCGLRSGQVECWGRGDSGELGDGTQTSRGTAAPVMNLTDAVSVVGLSQSTCALRSTGRVSCWGLNAQGAVGDGSTTAMYLVPYDLPLTNVSQITARTSRHVCATQNGSILCWGGNSNGQLGNGTVGGMSGVPTAVVGLP